MAIYLQLNGIKGNATEKNHKDWIVLNTIKFGVERPTIMSFGKKENVDYGNMKFQQILATKFSDQSTPLLYQACCIAKPFDKIIIQVSNSDEYQSYLEYTLENAMISSYQVSGFSSEDNESEFAESLKFAYGKMTIKFVPTDSNHRAQSPITAGYDLTTCQRV